jgi:hypothetical protein
MTAVRVDILCECDACQKRFGVEIDTGTTLTDFKDFDALARETIVNGNATYYVWGVRGKATVERYPLPSNPTIQGGLMLCDVCSAICDALPIEDDLTREEVLAALKLPSED